MYEYLKILDGVEVWVTLRKPMIYDSATKEYVESEKYCAAFKFGQRPGLSDGELVRDQTGELSWFANPADAAKEAFCIAAKRINGSN